MATTATQSISGPSLNSGKSVPEILQKYDEERDKRLRDDGQAQYVDVYRSDKFKHFAADPWLPDDGNVSGITLDGDARFKFVILGAGYGGLLYAIRLVQAGYSPSEIVMIDSAGGFGGTWYWNRYPGLMCDVESYCYMPLLEETGHIPAHRYAYGTELRQHANNIAKKWGVEERGIFRATFDSVTWDDVESEWTINVVQNQGPKNNPTQVQAQIRGSYVISLSGLLNYPKLPKLPGLEEFQGHTFHTSRWDYKYTGGSSADPSLLNLRDKRVGYIGTGATAIQAIPHLAKHAKELYIFQRTPSAVDERGQHETDAATFKTEIANQPNWQRQRMTNFALIMANDPRRETGELPDVVNDGWSSITSYTGLIGGPRIGNVEPTPESIGAYIQWLHAMDLPRSERVRARVDSIVKDPKTASKLKAWYPAWCKRPCFHDDYLPVFNQPNVHLVDTDGRGVDRLSASGVIVNGTECPVDVLIWGTGFGSPSGGGPDSRAASTFTGRDGLTMAQKWVQGTGTLHGVATRGFPNLFFPGPNGCGVTANQMFVLDVTSEHVAHIISKAERRAEPKSGSSSETASVSSTDDDVKITIEPSEAAEEAWTGQVMGMAHALAATAGCTPSYLNLEGATAKMAQAPLEVRMKAARASFWAKGIMDYLGQIEQWRAQGGLEGFEVNRIVGKD